MKSDQVSTRFAFSFYLIVKIEFYGMIQYKYKKEYLMEENSGLKRAGTARVVSYHLFVPKF